MENVFDGGKRNDAPEEASIDLQNDEEATDEDSHKKKKKKRLRGMKTWIPAARDISERSRWGNQHKSQEPNGLLTTSGIKVLKRCQQQLKNVQASKQLTSWI